MSRRARERWVLVARNTAYEVSDRGRVRRVGAQWPLKVATTNRGYHKVSLGRKQQPYVHTLVAEAFLGPRPAGHEVDHLDWDRTNNALGNLRWLTRAENCVRWQARTTDGRNVWSTPDSPPPVDHVPLTDDETAAITERLAASGW